MMNAVNIDIEVQKTEKGTYTVTCPFCDWNAIGFIHGFCVRKLTDHMNEKHYEGRIGNS